MNVEKAKLVRDELVSGIDWAFLGTCPALRSLAIHALPGVCDALVEVLLAPKHLSELRLTDLCYWKASAANIGRLRARLLAERPACHVHVTEC